MVKAAAFAVPGSLDTPTGGYTYDRCIIADLPAFGWQVDVIDLGEGFPRPSAATLADARARLLAVPQGHPIVVDGLAFGVMAEAAAELARAHPLIALVHHPLALETGVSPAEAEALRSSERAALASASGGVIVTSPATARLVGADYAVAPERISIVVPGTDRRPPARGSTGGLVSLLAVGAVVPRKGHDLLVTALAAVSDLPWRLTIAGDRTRDPTADSALVATIRRLGLGERVTLAGAVSDDQLVALYDAADLFVLASRFEGYGMALAAAMAHGLPVVGTAAGAIPETVPSDAAILVPPDDAVALAAALRRLIGDARERAQRAAAARAVALPTWREQAALFARALEACAERRA